MVHKTYILDSALAHGYSATNIQIVSARDNGQFALNTFKEATILLAKV